MNCFTDDQLNRIKHLVREIEKLSDVEKLFLYLQLPFGQTESPEGKSRFNSSKSASNNNNGTNSDLFLKKPDQETTQTYTWILSHLEVDPQVSLPKQEVYEEYKAFCSINRFEPLCVADFGKAMKHAFPCIKPRRLGQRGNSRYCYSGLRKKYKIQPPNLPDLIEATFCMDNDCTQAYNQIIEGCRNFPDDCPLTVGYEGVMNLKIEPPNSNGNHNHHNHHHQSYSSNGNSSSSSNNNNQNSSYGAGNDHSSALQNNVNVKHTATDDDSTIELTTGGGGGGAGPMSSSSSIGGASDMVATHLALQPINSIEQQQQQLVIHQPQHVITSAANQHHHHQNHHIGSNVFSQQPNHLHHQAQVYGYGGFLQPPGSPDDDDYHHNYQDFGALPPQIFSIASTSAAASASTFPPVSSNESFHQIAANFVYQQPSTSNLKISQQQQQQQEHPIMGVAGGPEQASSQQQHANLIGGLGANASGELIDNNHQQQQHLSFGPASTNSTRRNGLMSKMNVVNNLQPITNTSGLHFESCASPFQSPAPTPFPVVTLADQQSHQQQEAGQQQDNYYSSGGDHHFVRHYPNS